MPLEASRGGVAASVLINQNIFCIQIVTSGRYFAAYYMNLRNLEERVKNKEAPLVDIVDIYDRATGMSFISWYTQSQ